MKAESTVLEEEQTAGQRLGAALQWACSPRGGNNFYGRVLNGCSRHAVEGLGTCGIALDTKGRYTLLWDPKTFAEWEQPLRLLVIVHEAAHLVLSHIERSLRILRDVTDPQQLERLREILNVAADMTVNDVSVRPMTCDTHTRFSEFKSKFIWPEDREYPTGQTFEEYAALLLADLKQHGWTVKDGGKGTGAASSTPTPGNGEKEDQPDGGGGSGSSEKDQSGEGGTCKDEEQSADSGLPQWFKNLLSKQHAPVPGQQAFDKMTDGEIERVLDRARREASRIARSAVEQTRKSRGTIPSCMQDAITGLMAEPTVPWQQVLRGRIKSQISHKLNESTAYPNVALIHNDDYEPYPGYEKDFTFSMLAAFDTSGSMSNDDFKDCCKELLGILKEEESACIRLLMFDAAIQSEKDLTADDADGIIQGGLIRHGCGGTVFDPVLKYASGEDVDSDWVTNAERENTPLSNPDLMLIFTDGYAPVPLPELSPKCSLIWVLTENGDEDKEMREVLRMKQ